jgi:hypothetical protein
MRTGSTPDAGAWIRAESTAHLPSWALLHSLTLSASPLIARAYLELLATGTSTGPTARTLHATGRGGTLRGGAGHVFRSVLDTGVYGRII